MKKIANFTKQSIRNGAVVLGGHRVKYVSNDKEFVVIYNKYGMYMGFYLTYESDGAFIDEDRSCLSDQNKFASIEDCLKFYRIGEETKKEEVEATATKEVELSPVMKQYHDLKAKHPDALLLFRCGDFYDAYLDDAKECARILGITLTRLSTSGQYMAGFPHHALDAYLPQLIRAGKRVAICDQLEDPRLTKRLVKRGITEMVIPKASEDPKSEPAKEIKMEVADAIVKELDLTSSTTTQDGMRKLVTEACVSLGISVDHVSIWQHNGNGDYGLAVAFYGKHPVAVCQWERTFGEKGKTYTFVTDKADKYTALRKRI